MLHYSGPHLVTRLYCQPKIRVTRSCNWQSEVEYLTIANDRYSCSRKLNRMPERYLIRCQYRARKILFQGMDHADRAQAITADENSLSTFGDVSAYPLVELARMNRPLVRW